MKEGMKKFEYPKSRLYNILFSGVVVYFGIEALRHASPENGRDWGWVMIVGGLGFIAYNCYKILKTKKIEY